MASRTSSSFKAAALKNSVLTDLRDAQVAWANANDDRAKAGERRAEAVRSLLNDFGMTHAQLAEVLGVSVAMVGKIRDFKL